MTVKQLKDDLAGLLGRIRSISAEAEKANRDFTDEERAQVTDLLAKANELKDQIKAADGDAELRKAIADFGADVGIDEDKPEKGKPVKPAKTGSLGERFVKSNEFSDWLKTFPNGQPGEKSRVHSPPVGFGGMKDIFGSTDATDGLIPPDRRGLLDGLLFRPFTVRDIITNGSTDSDVVEFVRENAKTNNAAPVAEASGTSGGDGGSDVAGIKPESSFSLEKVTTNVRTIAHWVPATKRVLSDAGQMRTLIDNFLRSGLDEELEDQIVLGNGTGENFTGLSNTAGVQAQAFDTDLLRTARKARTKVKTVGRAVPTAYLLHPTDWEAFDLLKDDQGRYYFGGPAEMGMPKLWGLPVVESEAVTQGVGYVGDFHKAVLWDRQQATVQISDSHADFFVRNLVAILAELRAAFGVIRPAAFVEIDLTA